MGQDQAVEAVVVKGLVQDLLVVPVAYTVEAVVEAVVELLSEVLVVLAVKDSVS
jgi:hypothetical protein